MVSKRAVKPQNGAESDISGGGGFSKIPFSNRWSDPKTGLKRAKRLSSTTLRPMNISYKYLPSFPFVVQQNQIYETPPLYQDGSAEPMWPQIRT